MNAPTRGKGKQVSATVSPELYDALEDYGWNNRKTRTDLVRQAVEEFAERNGILPAPEPLQMGESGENVSREDQES